MRELPRGKVTLLFTDVVGSTRLLQELGAEAYAEALSEHRRVVRAALARHGGVEVDTQGDAFFAAFPEAGGAVAAAREATEALSGPVRVRIGVHTGQPHVADQGYVGEDVHLGARIAAAGHGGQVLLSRATRDLVDGDTVDLGEHRLKDFGAPVWIFQLGGERFPPLKTISNTNLPRPASSFLGRGREVAEVTELIRRGARLVTLTGAGGSGKTRLAIEAAAELVPEFGSGVFWVPFASLRDATLVLPTIAQTLGVTDGLPEHIGERELLLLLDNFEQLVAGAPELASLVESCQSLRLLITSRELLRVRGEVEYIVAPLTDEGATLLFSERSQLPIDATVAELCHRLDNLPLAVELAAARAKVLSPAGIVERLSQRLDFLKAGRDAESRQRTLRATLDWSYELLEPEEQQLMRRLSVFAGGCTLAAAEAIAGADLGRLQSLVEKSLLRFSGERYWLLETIREYALDRLELADETVAIRGRHAAYFCHLAEGAGVSGEVPSAAELRPVRVELDNIRAALDWSVQAKPELALRLAVALEGFWAVQPIEGMRWLQLTIERAPKAPLRLRAHAWRALGGAANPAGREDVAQPAYEQSLSAFRSLRDERETAVLLLRLGYGALYRGEWKAARSLGAESLDAFRTVGNRAGEAQSLSLLGEVDRAEGDMRAGLEGMQRGAALADQVGFTWWRARMMGLVSDLLLELGRPQEAEAAVREAVGLAHELGDRLRVVRGLARLARIAVGRDEPAEAGLLWGAVEAEELRGPIGAWENERERFARAILARAGETFESARMRGRRLALDDVVDHTLAPTDSGT